MISPWVDISFLSKFVFCVTSRAQSMSIFFSAQDASFERAGSFHHHSNGFPVFLIAGTFTTDPVQSNERVVMELDYGLAII